MVPFEARMSAFTTLASLITILWWRDRHQRSTVTVTLAPWSVVSEDSLFYEKRGDNRLFKAFAPLNDRAVAIHVMNLNEEPGVRKAVIAARDYENGGAMTQPYPGPWRVPDEGLVLYDVLAGSGRKFSGQEVVSLDKPLAHKLFQLSPIRKG